MALRILVVDDDEDALTSMRDLLAHVPGHSVRAASSGAVALEALATEAFDVVVADFRMPGMDGLALLRRVAADHPATARVMVTAYPDLQLAIDALNMGGVERFLPKPVTADEFVRTVAEVGQQARRAWQRDAAWRRFLAAAEASSSDLRRGGGLAGTGRVGGGDAGGSGGRDP